MKPVIQRKLHRSIQLYIRWDLLGDGVRYNWEDNNPEIFEYLLRDIICLSSIPSLMLRRMTIRVSSLLGRIDLSLAKSTWGSWSSWRSNLLQSTRGSWSYWIDYQKRLSIAEFKFDLTDFDSSVSAWTLGL